ncbi:MAG: chemotaxis protein CheW [Planctomycetota bacterium]
MAVRVPRRVAVRLRDRMPHTAGLERLLGRGPGRGALAQGILIVVDLGGERCCLIVDETQGKQQVVIKSLGLPHDRVPGVAGGAIMGDGRVALILDIAGLFERPRMGESGPCEVRMGDRPAISVGRQEHGSVARPGNVAGGKFLCCRLANEEYGVAILSVREILGSVEITPLRAPRTSCAGSSTAAAGSCP